MGLWRRRRANRPEGNANSPPDIDGAQTGSEATESGGDMTRLNRVSDNNADGEDLSANPRMRSGDLAEDVDRQNQNTLSDVQEGEITLRYAGGGGEVPGESRGENLEAGNSQRSIGGDDDGNSREQVRRITTVSLSETRNRYLDETLNNSIDGGDEERAPNRSESDEKVSSDEDYDFCNACRIDTSNVDVDESSIFKFGSDDGSANLEEVGELPNQLPPPANPDEVPKHAGSFQPWDFMDSPWEVLWRRYQNDLSDNRSENSESDMSGYGSDCSVVSEPTPSCHADEEWESRLHADHECMVHCVPTEMELNLERSTLVPYKRYYDFQAQRSSVQSARTGNWFEKGRGYPRVCSVRIHPAYLIPHPGPQNLVLKVPDYEEQKKGLNWKTALRSSQLRSPLRWDSSGGMTNLNFRYLSMLFPKVNPDVIMDVLQTEHYEYTNAFDFLAQGMNDGAKPIVLDMVNEEKPLFHDLKMTQTDGTLVNKIGREFLWLFTHENIFDGEVITTIWENQHSSNEFVAFRVSQMKMSNLYQALKENQRERFHNDIFRDMKCNEVSLRSLMVLNCATWFFIWGELDFHQLRFRDALHLLRMVLKDCTWSIFRIAFGRGRKQTAVSKRSVRVRRGDAAPSRPTSLHDMIHNIFAAISDKSGEYTVLKEDAIEDLRQFVKMKRIQYKLYSRGTAVEVWREGAKASNVDFFVGM